MIRTPLLLIAGLAALGTSAEAAGLWGDHYHMGLHEYSVGRWDAAIGGALALSCGDDGQVAILAQIKGKAPAPGSRLRLTTSSRAGTGGAAFRIDRTGRAMIGATERAAFDRLWADLRRHDIVTLHYADGQTSVLSLAGAARTLSARPCR